MSDSQRRRDETREWLEMAASENPDGYPARLIDAYGITNLLNVHAVLDGEYWAADFRRLPWRNHKELRPLVEAARDAHYALCRALYVQMDVDAETEPKP